MSSEKEILEKYMKDKIQPIFDQLLRKLLYEKPDDVIAWSIQWLQKLQPQQKIGNNKPIVHQEESEEEEEEEEYAPENKKKQQTRTAVSAEVYGEYNKKEKFEPRFIQKTAAQVTKIKKRILNSFMFQALDEKDLEKVLGAMEEKKFKPDDWVIRQGDDGNELFIIDEGELECYKKFPGQDKERLLKTYIPGESFGELALLYNAPRAASIKAIKPVTAFALDRGTFNNIVKDAAIKKREQMEQILSKIELLQSMDNYERVQLCDVLKECRHTQGDAIIQQGDAGDKLFLIIEGRLEAYKKDQNDQLTKVYEYSEGDYFGELALLNNAPRQATIKAVTDVKLLYCDYNSFRKMMGPLEDILKRNKNRYEHYLH